MILFLVKIKVERVICKIKYLNLKFFKESSISFTFKIKFIFNVITLLKAFNIVNVKKRVWCAFNESTCTLLLYGCEKDFLAKKSPVSSISISRAAIIPAFSDENNFRIMFVDTSFNSNNKKNLIIVKSNILIGQMIKDMILKRIIRSRSWFG